MGENENQYLDLRYNIRYRLDRLHVRRRSAIRRQVMKAGVSESTYFEYLLIRKDEKRDIPGRALQAFSKALNVEIELLFNT